LIELIFRLILPMPRFSLSPSDVAKPIPSLSSRQYIVDKSGKSPEQIAREREVFWYREELLKSVRASWVEVGHGLQASFLLAAYVLVFLCLCLRGVISPCRSLSQLDKQATCDSRNGIANNTSLARYVEDNSVSEVKG
jgi:hypothetical protein